MNLVLGFRPLEKLHGVIRLPGSFTEITFVDTINEGWHGFTIGVEGLGEAVPAPGALAILGLELGLIGLGSIRRKTA